MMAGVTNVFDAAAQDFIALAPVLWDRIGQIVVESTPPRGGARVLDACCGVGSAALPAANCAGPNGQVDCVDLSAPLIEALKSRLADSPYVGRVHAFTADITTWDAGPYDQVLCILGLPFLPDPVGGAAHLAGLLGPAGRLVIAHWRSCSDSLDLPGVGAILAGVLQRLGGSVTPPHVGRASFSKDLAHPDSMKARLETLGLAAKATTAELRIPLDPTSLRLLVEGSAFRGMLTGLDATAREQAHALLAEKLAGRELDASLVVGIGQRNH
jgi:methyltransferase type 11